MGMAAKMRSLKKRLELIKICGLKNVITGTKKYRYYAGLQKEYGFDKWHQSPIELRRYALDIVEYVNKLVEAGEVEQVCEIGCGLGEIIRRCDAPEKFGYDIDPNVIEAAKFFDRDASKKITFSYGALGIDFFPDQPRIDCLITVNFIHGIEPEILRAAYAHLNNAVPIRYLIVDSCVGDDYAYSHDFSSILPASFNLVRKFGPYNPMRTVEIYKNEAADDNMITTIKEGYNNS